MCTRSTSMCRRCSGGSCLTARASSTATRLWAASTRPWRRRPRPRRRCVRVHARSRRPAGAGPCARARRPGPRLRLWPRKRRPAAPACSLALPCGKCRTAGAAARALHLGPWPAALRTQPPPTGPLPPHPQVMDEQVELAPGAALPEWEGGICWEHAGGRARPALSAGAPWAGRRIHEFEAAFDWDEAAGVCDGAVRTVSSIELRVVDVSARPE
ncbi:MAG: hypothetical protein J3K34DRAFT_414026 [Monoraphidium minutum]|nr:MAG: hypothetical protein J3K34DRAFT_414026 [Monoraphidium minutum]